LQRPTVCKDRQFDNRKKSQTSLYSSDSEDSVNYSIRLLGGISDISRSEWNSLISEDHSPFIEWDWISALEKSQCASANEGWQPLHVSVYDNNLIKLVAVMPLYIKFHSMGEFIFDHSWAEYAERVLGIKYYPKLLAAIPFTPAAGARYILLFR